MFVGAVLALRECIGGCLGIQMAGMWEGYVRQIFVFDADSVRQRVHQLCLVVR